MKLRIKRAILLALAALDGRPMGQGVLIDAAQMAMRPADPSEGDVIEALRDCEGDGFVVGVSDEFAGERTWTLTDKGVHKARQLR